MSAFKPVCPTEIDPAFDLIGKEWMLITAADKSQSGTKAVNAMTASWGGLGILWNRPVAFVFIRPQRYTYSLVEESDRFSLCFLGEEYRDALRLCGTKSGRDIDKLAACGLNTQTEGDLPYIAESRLVLCCRKLYAADLEQAGFLLPELLDNYKTGDFHRMYVVEIEQALLAQ